MVTSFQTALKRLVDTNWSQNYDHTRQGSYIALAREFCRRSAHWAERLSCTSKWPFFNIPLTIKPDFSDPRIEPALANIEFRQGLVRQVGSWYLLWHAIADADPDAIEAFALQPPYEPLVTLFERGCTTLVREHHLLYVGIAGIPITSWRSNLLLMPLASLDADAMCEIDKSYQDEYARRP